MSGAPPPRFVCPWLVFGLLLGAALSIAAAFLLR